MSRDRIAVFGSSEPRPGDTLYELARTLGAALGGAGYDVVTGGYGGVMEGASRGAREAGAGAHGVLCSVLPRGSGNPFLSSSETAPDLFARTRSLVDAASGFVVLDGKAGTLAELAFLWALDRARCLGPRPVVVFSSAWGAVVDTLERGGKLDGEQSSLAVHVDDVERAVDAIRTRLDPTRTPSR